MSLSQAIKEQAHLLGFSLAGITTADTLPHEKNFIDWLELGRQGEMEYLNRPRSRTCRAHPKEILAECQSVVVLGMRYPSPKRLGTTHDAANKTEGRIAAYARGEDYHDFIPERLQNLVKFIEVQVGHPIPKRMYTDTGPLLERELAQRAGLGWIGKNTCLIHPQQGSYLLLAEVLLGIELEPDAPFTIDRCGTCTRCINACPTGCILPDRTLDARRCISYLTIELKGAIPAELRALMNGWIFGCDVCQLVCPWNRFATQEASQVFEGDETEITPNLLLELKLSAEGFNKKFRHSPIRRAKRRGYLRNIAVALGNTHNRSVVPALDETLIAEAEPLVRAHAAWSLGQVGGGQARAALERGRDKEMDMSVRAEIEYALTHG